MPITAQHVRETVNAYLAEHPDEEDSLSALVRTLDRAGDTIASREEFRGHVTAGAALLRPDGRVLTIEHRVLRKWLLPGGHIEESDTALVEAALRELEEETGITPDRVEPDSGLPLHIDVHSIPANPKKGEPQHLHFDFRFLFRTTADMVELQEEEVTAYSWQFADTLTAEPLRSRVLNATR
ncbi:NUDIX domain-containing protein [Streptomyces scopuliridis]|uniref:NUDIX domain-containing protein n=1 Tax=Streptomyces scopuliridis TaxID=452529 RepID=A0ACD4ZNV8_9ACTN|nr:NUDIX domain-containing protein [Streptomyces scopuliridis]WSB99701.1 NUDIX domain-containing protein [Streptomyces scopuliridis]WSC06600.1 NUDIX domain-containing protein [Streptomyces scopuliridis]